MELRKDGPGIHVLIVTRFPPRNATRGNKTLTRCHSFSNKSCNVTINGPRHSHSSSSSCITERSILLYREIRYGTRACCPAKGIRSVDVETAPRHCPSSTARRKTVSTFECPHCVVSFSVASSPCPLRQPRVAEATPAILRGARVLSR